MTAVVAGDGGREFELARQLAQEYRVYVLGGNAGIAQLPGVECVHVNGQADIVSFVDENKIDLTVIGPEKLLAGGLADQLRAKGRLVFGPSAEAAKLESSKAFATDFMAAHNIPHPQSTIFRSKADALAWAATNDSLGYVIKADGLADDKGVFLPDTQEEALKIISEMMDGELLEGAGEQIVVQERLSGPEVSMFVVTDGHHVGILPASQDHKRLLEGDHGPNTGGMGAYSPVPESIMSVDQRKKAEAIAFKAIHGMELEGKPYQGVLFIGLMLAEQYSGDPVVIKFNARFGNPEAQVVLPVAASQIRQKPHIPADTIPMLLRSVAEGKLVNLPLRPEIGRTALTVCLVGEGYPGSKYGDAPRPVYGLDREYDDVIVHHAATRLDKEGRIVSGGGRILYVTGFGTDVDEAAARAYAALGPHAIHTEGGYYRPDIGRQVRKEYN